MLSGVTHPHRSEEEHEGVRSQATAVHRPSSVTSRQGVGGSPVNSGLLDKVAALPRSLRPSIERLKASPEGTRLATGVFWSVCGAVVQRGMMLVATMMVAWS